MVNYFAPESSFFPPDNECDFCGGDINSCHCFDHLKEDV